MALDAGRVADRVASFDKTVNIVVLPIARLRSLKSSPVSALLALSYFNELFRRVQRFLRQFRRSERR